MTGSALVPCPPVTSPGEPEVSGWDPAAGWRPPAGPHRPLPGTPAQPLGSVRRTTTTDTIRSAGSLGPATAVELRGRDRRLGPGGAVVAETTVSLRLELDPVSAEITAIDGESEDGPAWRAWSGPACGAASTRPRRRAR